MSTLKPGYKTGHLDYSAGKLTNATPMTAAHTNYQEETSFACSVPDLNCMLGAPEPPMHGACHVCGIRAK